MEEEKLDFGSVSSPVKIGNTVHRQAGPLRCLVLYLAGLKKNCIGCVNLEGKTLSHGQAFCVMVTSKKLPPTWAG